MSEVKLEIGKKVVELPEQLTIEQYMRLSQAEEKSNPIKFLSIITGLEERDVRYSKKSDVDFIYSYLVKKYLSPPSRELKPIIEHNGKRYGFDMNFDQFNFGCWVDLEMYIAGGVNQNLHKILSIVYRPIVKETKKGYVLEEYGEQDDERAEEFLTLPADIWFGAAKFFFSLGTEYSKITLASLEGKNKRMKTKMKAMKRLRKLISPFKRLRDVFTGSAS